MLCYRRGKQCWQMDWGKDTRVGHFSEALSVARPQHPPG